MYLVEPCKISQGFMLESPSMCLVSLLPTVSCFSATTTEKCKIWKIKALVVQRRLRWFGYAARRPDGELIKDIILPIPPRTWHRRTGRQLKAWATTIKAEVEPFYGPRAFGHARLRKDWVKVSSVFTQVRRAWNASVRDMVCSIGDVRSTHPG